MKKLVPILLGCFLLSISLFALTACNGGDENSNNPPHTHDYSIAKFDDKSHWFECECGKKSSVAFHNLINNACICGYQVTETHTHDYKTLKFDSISHWYECECGDKSNLENHKGGTATETSKPICSVCNSEYGSTLIHTHNFNKEVVDENYLKTPAKCESKAEYYYSCSCGEKGTNIFLYGDELGHKYSDFVSNGDGTHTKVCTNDNTHKIIKDCSGGTATCEKLAKCLDCKEEYGELSDHKYENGKCKWCEIKKLSEGLIYTLINNGTKYEVSSVGDCTDTDIVIPSIYNDKIVTSIGYCAFYSCESLTSIEIPDSVTSIGEAAFSSCFNLKTVTFGENSKLTSIGYCAFDSCSSLTSIEIPASVTSIGYAAFSGCNSLRYNEKDGLKYLGNSNNKYLYLAGTVSKEITTAIIDDNCKIIGLSAFYNCTSLTSIEIPNSVTSIGDYAFENCYSLTSIEIPDSVTSIGSMAFMDCYSLETIKVDGDNTVYKSIDGNLYSKDGKTLIRYARGKSATYFLIPDSVTSIGYCAFYSCSSLTSIEIPASVTSIGDGAFYNCYSLTSIEIPAGVTSIGERAFWHCESLESIEIPASVTSIGNYAFHYCYKLTDIYCEAESQPTGWGSYWKDGCYATVHWGAKIN